MVFLIAFVFGNVGLLSARAADTDPAAKSNPHKIMLSLGIIYIPSEK